MKIFTDGLSSAYVRACMCASACLPVRNRQLMTLSADKTIQWRRWRNNNDRRKQKNTEKHPSQCHSNTNSTL